MMDKRDEWLSSSDAAKRLGVTTKTLYEFIRDGGLVAYRFGRVLRFKAVDVEDFIERARVKPGELAHLYSELE